jgi:hypothetical protein
MTTAELAAQYGVALPETCIELKWENINTHFFWFVCDNTQKALLHIIQENRDGENYYRSINGGFAHNKFKIYPAPQMHEIAPIIENLAIEVYSVKMVNIKFDFTEQGLDKIQHLLCFENDCISENAIYVNIQNNHYVQAYAEMYLKLKSQNLLCQP